ncbi:hypothetical protein FQR65_LT19595 [Abscondita terminalis]|nr:hypothetical protein FQR65_LT19595 [Abscondita terminalis]
MDRMEVLQNTSSSSSSDEELFDMVGVLQRVRVFRERRNPFEVYSDAEFKDRITTERFITLAKEINDIFIHEEAAIYYLPYCKRSNGKIVAARGKLWSTYVHQRQLYKKAGLLKTRSDSTFNQACQPSTSRANTETDESEDFDILIWLQNNAEPFNQVHTYWERTASKRLKFENAPQSESIDAYLRRYPALGRQSGYILLDSDFKYLFPGENNNIFTKWPIFSKILWGILKTKKDSYLKERINQEIGEDQTEPNSDIVEILSLKYLPLLLQPPIIKSKAKHWKPSKQELIDAFILFVNDISEVDTVIQKRADKYLTYGLTAQPIPLFMGPYEILPRMYR